MSITVLIFTLTVAGCAAEDAPVSQAAGVLDAPERALCPAARRHIDWLIARIRDKPTADAECVPRDRREDYAADLAASPGLYFDGHGPCHEVLDLIVMFHDATEPVCSELRSLGGSGRENYVDALYRVLGYIGDPASIPWLQEALRGPQRRYVFTSWLEQWGCLAPPALCYGACQWVWTPEAWSAFLPELYCAAPDSAGRVAVLRRTMSVSCGPQTLAFLRQLDGNQDVTGWERITSAGYLIGAGESIDGGALAGALAQAKRQEGSVRPWMVLSANLAHEAVVPYLLEWLARAAPGEKPDPMCEYALRCATLEPDIEGPSAWRDWWERHQGETRGQWVERAIARIDAAVHVDTARAEKLIAQFLALDSAHAFECLARWEEEPLLHDAIARLICERYNPYWRADYERILKPIVEGTRDRLKPATLRKLRELDFVPGRVRLPWHDYIRGLLLQLGSPQ